jgi:hypothetical protein
LEKNSVMGVRHAAFNQSSSLAIVQPLIAIDRNVQNLFSGGLQKNDRAKKCGVWELCFVVTAIGWRLVMTIVFLVHGFCILSS